MIGAFMSHSIASNSFSRIIIVIYKEMAFLLSLSICRNGFVFYCFVSLLFFYSFVFIQTSRETSMRTA